MPRPFSVEPSTGPDGPCLRVQGDLDLVSAAAVRDAIVGFAEQNGEVVIVDMAGVEFIDSTGISAIVAAQNALRPAGQALTLQRVVPKVHRVLEIAGITQALRIEPTAPVAS